MIDGRARVFGDDINTDYIISSRRKRETIDPAQLRRYLFEDVDPQFAATLASGDLIVAGKNFGCGSAMEVAVTALAGAGVKAVLARSFSRTYFRNAVNNGLVPVACDTSGIREGERVSIQLGARDQGPGAGGIGCTGSRVELVIPGATGPQEAQHAIRVRNESAGIDIPAEPLAPLLVAIIQAGGLAPFFRKHGGFPVDL
jgi:3-isopropylmalate/(R)-2-methylmalate dehydratase small subunit